MTQIEIKPTCPFCKEQRQEKIHLNGNYVVSKEKKNADGSFGTTVYRFICKSCGEGFTKHLRIERGWNYGYVKNTKRRTMRTLHCEYDARNEGNIFKKLKSHHNEQKEKALFERIDEAVIRRGFLEVQQMKRFLGIGTTTYYRYLKNLHQKMFWNEDTPAIKSIDLKNGLLVELKTRLYIGDDEPKNPANRRKTIRVFILFDKETHLAFDFFIVRKKKYRSLFPSDKPESEIDYLGHIYSTPQVIGYAKLLKGRSAGLQIELDCQPQMKKMLLKASPDIFKKARASSAAFWKELEKFKLRRNLTFSWTLTGKKIEERPKSFVTQTGELQSQIRTLLSIYNRHHLVRLEKNGLNLRRKSIKPKTAS